MRMGRVTEGRAARPADGIGDLRLVLAVATGAGLLAAGLLFVVTVRTGQIQSGYRVHDLRTQLLRLKEERAMLEVERASLLRPARLAELGRTTLQLVPVDGERAVPASRNGTSP